MTDNNNIPEEFWTELTTGEKDTLDYHLESHADMFAPVEPQPDSTNALPDDATQTVTVAELREMLQMAYEQGRLRGYFMGQEELLRNIGNDPEVDQTTKDYFNNIYGGAE